MRNDVIHQDIPVFRNQEFIKALSVLYVKSIDTTSACLISLTAATLGLECTFRRRSETARPDVNPAALPKLYSVTSGEKTDHFVGCVATSTANLQSGRVIRSKNETRRVLAAAGIRTAAGGPVRWNDMSVLDSLEKAGVTSVTLKLDVSSMARGMLYDATLDQARAHLQAHPDLLFVAEQTVLGIERRFFFAGGVHAADMIKSRDHVLGNGKDTLRDLVRNKSLRQSQNPGAMANLTPAETKEAYLKAQGLDLSAVPQKGQFISVSAQPLTKFHYGGLQPRETRDEIYQLVADIARAVKTTSGAIDAIDTGAGGIFILEVNAKPSILAASFPINAARNLRLPEALLRSSFPDHQDKVRKVTSYDIVRLVKDYATQTDRDVFDVRDYMTFA